MILHMDYVMRMNITTERKEEMYSIIKCVYYVYRTHVDRYVRMYFLMAPGLPTSAEWYSHFGFAK